MDPILLAIIGGAGLFLLAFLLSAADSSSASRDARFYGDSQKESDWL